MSTLYIAIFEKEVPECCGTPQYEYAWRPWIGKDAAEDVAMTKGLALNKYIRERGGFFEDELPMSIFVLSRKTMDLPCAAMNTEYRVGATDRTPQREAA